MSTTGSDASARLRLVQGQSATRHREFTSADDKSVVITVGKHPSCDWVIAEPNVAPVQFSLHWDGSSLWAADLQGAGGVWVDEQVLGSEWRRLRIRVRIEFGSAAIVADCSAAGLGRRSERPPALNDDVRDGKTILSMGAVDVSRVVPANVQASAKPSTPAERVRVSRKPTMEGYVIQTDAPPAGSGSASVPPRGRPSKPPAIEVRAAPTSRSSSTERAQAQEAGSERPSASPSAERSQPSEGPRSRPSEGPRSRPSQPVAATSNGLVVREVNEGLVQTSATTYSRSERPLARAEVVSSERGSPDMPQGVLVLSPPHEGARQGGEQPSQTIRPQAWQPPEPPAQWGRVSLGVAAITIVYGLWVYLLTQL